VDQDLGGLGARVDAAVTTATELGAALHGSPYAGLTAGARALTRQHTPGVDDLATRVADGDAVCAWGRVDATGRTARLVDGAGDADALLLHDPARADLLLLADPAAWSIASGARGFDVSRRAPDVTFDPAAGHGVPHDPTAVALRGVLLAADALGCVRRMLDRTVTYAAERRAFGQPIGGFQAVQHRLVDHAVRARGMGLVVAEAARVLGDGAPGAAHAVALAEASVSSGAVHVLHDLLQLTGAIGFTWEHGLHLYERRAHQDARLAANPRTALRTIAGLEGWTRG